MQQRKKKLFRTIIFAYYLYTSNTFHKFLRGKYIMLSQEGSLHHNVVHVHIRSFHHLLILKILYLTRNIMQINKMYMIMI